MNRESEGDNTALSPTFRARPWEQQGKMKAYCRGKRERERENEAAFYSRELEKVAQKNITRVQIRCCRTMQPI